MQTVNLDKLPPQARIELLDFYEFLLNKYASPPSYQTTKQILKDNNALQPLVGNLATNLFGILMGVELNIPKHPPHEPLEIGL